MNWARLIKLPKLIKNYKKVPKTGEKTHTIVKKTPCFGQLRWPGRLVCDLGILPSPVFSRTDDGAWNTAKTEELYPTSNLSLCE